MTYGDLTFHQYCDKIDSVTASQINSVASKLLAGKPTLLVTGGSINLVPSVTDVSRQLNWDPLTRRSSNSNKTSPFPSKSRYTRGSLKWLAGRKCVLYNDYSKLQGCTKHKWQRGYKYKCIRRWTGLDNNKNIRSHNRKWKWVIKSCFILFRGLRYFW